MKLRKFSVAILDDRESGWKNAISVLFHDKYVKYNHASDIISRTTEFDFSIFSPDNDYSLKKAIKHIESGVDFDIYVIDIDLCENKFAYGYDYEKIAGLYFLDVTMKILICDSNDNRRNSLKDNIEKVCNIEVIAKEYCNLSSVAEITEDIDIFLIHASDYRNDTIFEIPCIDTPNLIVVIYSGGNCSNFAEYSTNFYVVNREISNANDLNIVEAITTYSSNRNKEEFFQILHGVDFEFLLSLSILCQGYLTTNSDSDNNTVKDALKEMGWHTFKNSSNYRIHTDISEKKSDTQKTSWWLESFDNMPVEEIYKQIVKEWDEKQGGKTCAPAPVYRLLEVLKQNAIEDPEIIAEAYIAIAQKLGYHQPEISLPDNIEIDELPNSVMILGNTPVAIPGSRFAAKHYVNAIALSQVLALFDIEVFLYPTISEVSSIDLEYFKDFEEDILVITLVDNPAETLRQLRYLRKNFWEGKFIAIASLSSRRSANAAGITANASSQKDIKQLDVFGDAEGRFQFDKMPGQIALSQPILLCDLLLAPYATTKMYSEGWEDCQAKSGIGKLLKQIKRAEDLVNIGDLTGADKVVKEIIQKMASISWATILPHHNELHPEDYLSMVKVLIASSDRVTLDNNIEHIPKIRRILSFVLGEAK